MATRGCKLGPKVGWSSAMLATVEGFGIPLQGVSQINVMHRAELAPADSQLRSPCFAVCINDPRTSNAHSLQEKAWRLCHQIRVDHRATRNHEGIVRLPAAECSHCSMLVVGRSGPEYFLLGPWIIPTAGQNPSSVAQQALRNNSKSSQPTHQTCNK